MNAVGVRLGNGWYSAEQHGDQMEVPSDQTWTGREGSIRHDSIYNGEVYDSRNNRVNWSRPGPDALHSAILIDSLSQSYLKHEEIGKIEGASLMDGGILKPIATWVSDSDMFATDREVRH